jgi:hypothetical protein
MQESFFIDDSGSLWESGSLRLRLELTATQLGEQFSDYVVKNLGFVRLSRQRTSATVHFRPETVSRLALVRLLSWLADEKPERVIINTYVDSSWQYCLIASTGEASELLTMSAQLLGDDPAFAERGSCEEAGSHPDSTAGESPRLANER